MNRIKLTSLAAIFIAALFVASQAKAFDLENHKGAYIWGGVGNMLLNNDTNTRGATDVTFGSAIELGYGLTVGHNITDWIAPEIQFNYSTSSGNTPSGTGREHALSIRLNGKYSFLTNSGFNENRTWKFFPYVKAGGVAHALYVNAPSTNDKVGSWGWGFGVGGGLEVSYKIMYLGLDLSNDLLFLQDYNKTIAGVNTQIVDGGFDYQFSAMASVGVHF